MKKQKDLIKRVIWCETCSHERLHYLDLVKTNQKDGQIVCTFLSVCVECSEKNRSISSVPVKTNTIPVTSWNALMSQEIYAK